MWAIGRVLSCLAVWYDLDDAAVGGATGDSSVALGIGGLLEYSLCGS